MSIEQFFDRSHARFAGYFCFHLRFIYDEKGWVAWQRLLLALRPPVALFLIIIIRLFLITDVKNKESSIKVNKDQTVLVAEIDFYQITTYI